MSDSAWVAIIASLFPSEVRGEVGCALRSGVERRSANVFAGQFGANYLRLYGANVSHCLVTRAVQLPVRAR